MNRAEVESYNRYEEEEKRKRERLHEEIVRYYNRNNIFISSSFLEHLRHCDKFIYSIFLKKEDVPKEVVDWLKKKVF